MSDESREWFLTEQLESQTANAFALLARAEAAEARVAALTQVAEAARAFMDCGPDYGGQGAEDWEAYCERFDDAYAALKAALDGLVGLHEQEQK